MSQRHPRTHSDIEFGVPLELEHPALIDAIGRVLPVIRGSDRTLSRRYYDSFDWRLFTAGVSLEGRFDEVATSPILL